MIEYSIDGGAPLTTDTWTPWSGSLHLPWPLVLADSLPQGKHRLTLRVTDRKPDRTALHIIRFLVN